ncbi:MAG: MlaD family protein [Fimbriiglobus sp.]|nr:MlaD family protein [Fimbriiglobus sp.]
MADRQMRVRLGLFVATALAAVSGLVITFGGAPNIFSTRTRYSVFFPETPGLAVGTPVRKSGVRIGQVTGIELDEPTNRVRVRIELTNTHLPRTTEDVFISRGLLSGDTTLDFIPKVDREGKPLPIGDTYSPGTDIEGVPPLNTQRLINVAQQTVPNAQEALTKFTATISKFEQVGPKAERSLDEIAALVRSAREVVPELRQTNKQVQEFIGTQVKADDEPPANLRTLTREVQEFVKATKPLLENLNTLVANNQEDVKKVLVAVQLVLKNFNEVLSDDNRKALTNTLKNLEVGSKELLSEDNRTLVTQILKNLGAASGDIKSAGSDIKEAATNIKTTFATAKGLVDDARKSLGEIDKAVKAGGEALQGAGPVVKSFTDRLDQVKRVLENADRAIKPIADNAEPVLKNVAKAADELAGTVSEARGILKLLQQSDGTFGKVLNDPQLYNQLVESAAALTRTLTRAEKIAKDLEVFADKVARKPETIGIGGAIRPSTGLKDSPFAPVSPLTPFPMPSPGVPGNSVRPIPPVSGGVEAIPPSSSYKHDPDGPAATIVPGPRVQPIQPIRGPVDGR